MKQLKKMKVLTGEAHDTHLDPKQSDLPDLSGNTGSTQGMLRKREDLW